MSGLINMIYKGQSDDLYNLKVLRYRVVSTCNWWEMTSDKLGKCFNDNDYLNFGKGNKLCRLTRKHWA